MSRRVSDVMSMGSEWRVKVKVDSKARRTLHYEAALACLNKKQKYRMTDVYLGSGSYGEVRQVCSVSDVKDCSYVGKWQALETQDDVLAFSAEIQANELLSKVDVVPKFVSAMVCRPDGAVDLRVGLLLSQRWDTNLHRVSLRHYDFERVVAVIDRMHDHKYWHQDLAGTNLLARRVPSSLTEYELAVTDLGMALQMDRMTPLLRAMDFVGLIYDRKKHPRRLKLHDPARAEALLVNRFGEGLWEHAKKLRYARDVSSSHVMPGMYQEAFRHASGALLKRMGVDSFFYNYAIYMKRLPPHLRESETLLLKALLKLRMKS